MNNKTEHPHAALLTEWLKDTSRTIEGRNTKITTRDWAPFFASQVIKEEYEEWEFRLIKTVILTEKQIKDINKHSEIPNTN